MVYGADSDIFDSLETVNDDVSKWKKYDEIESQIC